MKLPNSENAVVDMRKLLDYCLSPDHPRGRHKARVFAARLGFGAANADVLRDLLLSAVATLDAVPTRSDNYGQRYTIDIVVMRPTENVTVRSCWIIRAGEDFARLTSCYVL